MRNLFTVNLVQARHSLSDTFFLLNFMFPLTERLNA